jgi:hypothetical protein
MIMKTKSWLKIIKCLCRRNQLLFIQNPAVQPLYYNTLSLGTGRMEYRRH